MTATLRPTDIADEPTTAGSDDTFDALVRRLNDQSVRKHFDAFEDVPWDDFPIDPDDPRWELDANDPLGATAWYQALPQVARANLGLHLVASKMQVGYFFEGVLKRGLLEYSQTLPAGSPELRYVYHEVIEEAHHSQMFQEFCGRAGHGTVPQIPLDARIGSRFVVRLAKIFPELFFIFVLGGEDPIDHVQREVLRAERDRPLHPLVERIMRIHVTEEARHLSFARHWLKTRVPKLGRVRTAILAVGAPMILGEMGGMMLQPSKDVIRRFDIPKAVLDEAFHDNAEFQASAAQSLRKVRQLCIDLGLVDAITKPIWKAKNIWGTND